MEGTIAAAVIALKKALYGLAPHLGHDSNAQMLKRLPAERVQLVRHLICLNRRDGHAASRRMSERDSNSRHCRPRFLRVFRPEYFGRQVLRSGEKRQPENDSGTTQRLGSTQVQSRNPQISADNQTATGLQRNQFLKGLAEREGLTPYDALIPHTTRTPCHRSFKRSWT
jgi:hypothetical protein